MLTMMADPLLASALTVSNPPPSASSKGESYRQQHKSTLTALAIIARRSPAAHDHRCGPTLMADRWSHHAGKQHPGELVTFGWPMVSAWRLRLLSMRVNFPARRPRSVNLEVAALRSRALGSSLPHAPTRKRSNRSAYFPTQRLNVINGIPAMNSSANCLTAHDLARRYARQPHATPFSGQPSTLII